MRRRSRKAASIRVSATVTEVRRDFEARDKGRDGRIEPHRGQRWHVERRAERGIADFGDARRTVDRGTGPVGAWIEPRIGDDLATAPQSPGSGISVQHTGQRRTAPRDTEQQVGRLRNSASWSIVSQMARSIASS